LYLETLVLSVTLLIELVTKLFSEFDLVMEFCLFALLAVGIEFALRPRWPGIPPYKRHLVIFATLGFFSVLRCACNILIVNQNYVVISIFFDFFGASLGLALSSLSWLSGRRLSGFGWQLGVGLRRNPAAPLILVADPHWHESLVGLKEAAASYPGADWLFLGDVFDVWIGIPGKHTRLELEFLNWVRELRSNRIWVGLWLGNREFFLDHLSDQFDLIGEGIGGYMVGEGLCWEHGDLVNSSDWRYRLWNIVTHSGVVWILIRISPSFLVYSIANYLKKAVRSCDGVNKQSFPENDFLEAAAVHRDKTFITGHFHQYRVYGNGVSLPWAKDGKFMVWHNGEVKLLDCLNSK